MDATQAEAVTGAIGGAIGSADTVTRADLSALELRLTKSACSEADDVRPAAPLPASSPAA